MDAGQFLVALWGERPPGQVLVWRLPGKKSLWYFDLSKVQINGWSKEDVYFGVGLAAPDVKLRANQRVKAEAIIGIAGLWSDVDISDAVHTKPNLPSGFDTAHGLLDRMPLAPTIVINSGHGLQAWWLFEEPWIFKDEAERKLASEISRWWNGELKTLAAKDGLDVDSTHDLARVMRLPGTVNNKAEPVDVTVNYSNGPRHGLAAVKKLYSNSGPHAPFQSDAPLHDYVQSAYLAEDIDSAAGDIPYLKIDALMENDAKFKRTWNRRRPDLQDQSQSAYDMSLATLASAAEWTPLEIANLLKAHRIKHGSADDPKLQRGDYYQRTIAKAQQSSETDRATAIKMDKIESDFKETGDETEYKRARVAAEFGLGDLRLKKFLGDPPTYRLETAFGAVTLGGIDNVTNQRKFRNHIADVTGKFIRGVGKTQWDEKANSLLAIAEDVDTGEASHPANLMAGLIGDYLFGKTIHPALDNAFPAGLPFIREGVTYIQLGGLKQFLSLQGDRFSHKELSYHLSLYGAEPHKINGIIDSKRTSKFYWALPATNAN